MRTGVLMALAGFSVVAVGPAPALAQTFSTYQCRDGSEFVLALYEGDRAAHLQLDGRALALPKRLSVNGTRYSKGDVTLRITKAGATTLTRGKKSTQCVK
jgi:membrane-bound inhibitor of C-type lysozyme